MASNGRNQSAGDVELSLPGGGSLALELDPEADPNWKPGTPFSIASALAATTEASPIVPRLSQRTLGNEEIRKGIGLGYNAAYSCWTRDGYVMPAGAAHNVVISGAGHPNFSQSPIIAFAEFNGAVYAAQQGGGGFGGRIIRITSSGGATTATEVIAVSSGRFIRDLLVTVTQAATLTPARQTILYFTVEDANHANGSIYWSTDGTTWTNANLATTRGAGRMATEFMQPQGETGSWRVIVITGPKTFAYTLPGHDFYEGTAGLTADVIVATRGSLIEIVAARRHFWLSATDNVYDVDDLAQTSGLTSYLPRMQQPGNGQAVLFRDGYVYFSFGRGMVRIRVSENALLVETPEQCAPGWGTLAENDIRGMITAMCPDQHGFFSSTYNPAAQKSFVCWNVVRDFEDPRTRNPLAAHGPEVVYTNDYQVTRMLTSGLFGDLRLWCAAFSVTTGNVARLDWISLPVNGSPLADLVTGDNTNYMQYATGGGAPIVQSLVWLETMRDGWDDQGADQHILFQDTFVTRGLSKQIQQDGTIHDDLIQTRLHLRSRADAPPGDPNWFDTGDILVSPYQDSIQPDISASGVVQGRFTQLKIEFHSPNGNVFPPRVGILETVRRQGWTEAPTLRVVTLPIKYGDGCRLAVASDPDDITATLKMLSGSIKITLRDHWGKRWTFKLDQVLNVSEEIVTTGQWGKRVHALIRGAYVDGPL